MYDVLYVFILNKSIFIHSDSLAFIPVELRAVASSAFYQ